MSCGIYKITNLINNKVYIGQSIDIEQRWYNHLHRHQRSKDLPLYRAFKKYGITNFAFNIIEECNVQNLDEREKYWIQYYDSYNNGYNMTTGGQGTHNIEIKLSAKDIKNIINLLQDDKLSQGEIAELYNVGQDTISEINQGKTRRQNNIEYPIRQFKKDKNYICPLCGKYKCHTATYCNKCNHIYQRKQERPNRETLKTLIRNKSFVDIGKQYNVTDNTIKKWCKYYNLPYRRKNIKLYTDKEWEII